MEFNLVKNQIKVKFHMAGGVHSYKLYRILHNFEFFKTKLQVGNVPIPNKGTVYL